jgi:hypothetical protein
MNDDPGEWETMPSVIDTQFDFYSDTPPGRDPDSFSPTLRRYHMLLWSKTLPVGGDFLLSADQPGTYLHHGSSIGDFALSSDSIGHTYRYVKAMEHIVREIEADDIQRFFQTCSTIGAYIVFPSRRIAGKPTINGARGLSRQIRDRFDLTLECIRRHYLTEESPLRDTLSRYADFFALFGSFRGYVEYFLLQDLVVDDGSSVKFFLPFEGFHAQPLPTDVGDYQAYKAAVTTFVTARNRRIREEA